MVLYKIIFGLVLFVFSIFFSKWVRDDLLRELLEGNFFPLPENHRLRVLEKLKTLPYRILDFFGWFIVVVGSIFSSMGVVGAILNNVLMSGIFVYCLGIVFRIIIAERVAGSEFSRYMEENI